MKLRRLRVQSTKRKAFGISPLEVRTRKKRKTQVVQPAVAAVGRDTLRGLLASYDGEVEAALRAAVDATTGLERVRVMHQTRKVVAVHDAILLSALCPLLEDLPGGAEVARRLRDGCGERAQLLQRYADATKNVAAHNVYPVSGDEIEDILDGLERSLRAHISDETIQVGDLLAASAASVDPEIVAVHMAIEAERAPTRAHRATSKHPNAVALKRYYRLQDRWADWRDSHNGWLKPDAVRQSPRTLQVAALLKGLGGGTPPTIRDVLGGYDDTVQAVIRDWVAATTWQAKSEAVQQLTAAVTVHDAVLGGVLCPLLEALPDGKAPAGRLQDGCRQRAELQQRIHQLGSRTRAEDRGEQYRAEFEELVATLVESFRAHVQQETSEVSQLLEQLPGDTYRTKSSLLADAMWPWHSEGPEILALRMALWAGSSPSRPHTLLSKHPSSHTLRRGYRIADHLRHFSADTPLERWLVPKLPPAPFSSQQADDSEQDGPSSDLR